MADIASAGYVNEIVDALKIQSDWAQSDPAALVMSDGGAGGRGAGGTGSTGASDTSFVRIYKFGNV